MPEGPGNVVGIEDLAGVADVVDDDAAAAVAHGRIDGAGQVDIAVNLEVPPLAPGRFADGFQVPARDAAGVVYQYVNVARGRGDRVDDSGGGQITREDIHRHAVAVGQPGLDRQQPDLVPGDQQKVYTFARERLGEPFADSLRGAGNQRPPAG